VLLLFLGLSSWTLNASAEEETTEVEFLTGELWTKMSKDQKVTFIWGMGHVVEIEQELMHMYPELKRDSFVMKVVEGMADVPMNSIVAKIDEYYKNNPGTLHIPVVAVIWELMIEPNIKTGIAGKPLE
jgi:hypothetical protein